MASTLDDSVVPAEFRGYKVHDIGFEARDLRDIRASAVEPQAEILPDTYELPRTFDVRDQGYIGSCVAHAVAAMLEHRFYRTYGASPRLSPQQLYYVARVVDGSQAVDAGTYVRSALKAARRWGICPEDLWPYDGFETRRVAEQPDLPARFQATFWKPSLYTRLDTIHAMESAIAQGRGFCGIFYLTEGFYRSTATGDVPEPYEGEGTRGAHSCFFVGYDRPRRRFLFRNSWGERYGSRGYGTLPYAFVVEGNEARTWMNDCWSAH